MRMGCLLAALCLAALLAGCAPVRPYPPLIAPPSARLVEVRSGPAESSAAIQTVALKPRNVLVLSGGGRNGAYTAGVLKGWSASGQRPRFDVVTGISTGALIAPFAFLGAEYDPTLEQAYTTAQDKDVFRERPLVALPWAASFADNTPLRKHIESQITPAVLTAVARAHSEGRRLYVGTTDLDAMRQVVWDMGAIASGNDPDKLELFRRVLLASASVPGLLPPVPINIVVDGVRHTELHVDGGVSASLFLRPDMLGAKPGPNGAGRQEANIFVIVAGKVRPAVKPVKGWLVEVSEESVQGLLQSQFEGDLLRLYMLAHLRGAQFAVTAIPESFGGQKDSLSFDPQVMRALFEVGYRAAAAGTAWASSPPGLTSKEQPPPRGGVHFRLQQGS
jgi:predicted patatin/cPLA2 family phospholipase